MNKSLAIFVMAALIALTGCTSEPEPEKASKAAPKTQQSVPAEVKVPEVEEVAPDDLPEPVAAVEVVAPVPATPVEVYTGPTYIPEAVAPVEVAAVPQAVEVPAVAAEVIPEPQQEEQTFPDLDNTGYQEAVPSPPCMQDESCFVGVDAQSWVREITGVADLEVQEHAGVIEGCDTTAEVLCLVSPRSAYIHPGNVGQAGARATIADMVF